MNLRPIARLSMLHHRGDSAYGWRPCAIVAAFKIARDPKPIGGGVAAPVLTASQACLKPLFELASPHPASQTRNLNARGKQRRFSFTHRRKPSPDETALPRFAPHGPRRQSCLPPPFEAASAGVLAGRKGGRA